MFSFSNSPVKFEVLTAQTPGQGLSALSESPLSADFSNILAGMEISPEVETGPVVELPAEIQQLLQDAGVSSDQLAQLNKLLMDGKKLPIAAETAVQAIKQLLADKTETNTETEIDLHELNDRLNQLMAKLPSQVREKLETLSEKLNQIVARLTEHQPVTDTPETDDPAQVQQELTGIATAAETADLSTPKSFDSDSAVSIQPATDKKPQGAAEKVADTVVETLEQEAALPHENAPQSAAQAVADVLRQERQIIPKAVENAQAIHQRAAEVNQANERSPAFQNTVYGQSAQTDAAAVTEEQLANSKSQPVVDKSQNSNLNNLRMQSVAWQSVSAATATLLSSGGEGASSGGMGGQSGQGTSFLQMMSQAGPQMVTQNIHKPEWGTAVGDRITWMVGRGLQQAQLKITPAHLGPIEMKVNIDKQNNAQVTFVSQHQVVRDALEQAIPRLREMLSEQDMDLVDVDIRDQQADQQNAFAGQMTHDGNNSSAGAHGQQHADDEATEDEADTVVQIQSNQLLDAYA